MDVATTVVNVGRVDMIGLARVLVVELGLANATLLNVDKVIGDRLPAVEGKLEIDTDATVVGTTGEEPKVVTIRGTLELPDSEQISSKALLNATTCQREISFRRPGSIYHNHQLRYTDL